MGLDKEKIQSNKKVISIEYLLVIFIALMILAVLIMPNAFAKFSEAANFNDGARIAKWSVNVTDDASTKDIILNDASKSGEFKFTTYNHKEIAGLGNVTNETACKFKIRVVMPDSDPDLPDKVTMTLSYTSGNNKIVVLPSKSNKSEDASSHEGKEYIFESSDFQFGPADQKSLPISLVFTMNDGCSVTSVINDIKVYADFEQLD